MEGTARAKAQRHQSAAGEGNVEKLSVKETEGKGHNWVGGELAQRSRTGGSKQGRESSVKSTGGEAEPGPKIRINGSPLSSASIFRPGDGGVGVSCYTHTHTYTQTCTLTHSYLHRSTLRLHASFFWGARDSHNLTAILLKQI